MLSINCFYFGKYGYTFVPSQIEEDLQRIKSTGADSVTLNVIEQDYSAAFENITLVISLARKLGLQVYALPDGWGNLVGSISGFPSVQAVRKKKDCLADEYSNCIMTEKGWVLDPNREQVFNFFKKKLTEVLVKFNFDGLFWFHPDERTAMAPNALLFKKLHAYVSEKYSDKTVYYHATSDTFLNAIDVQQKMNSAILPNSLEALKKWTVPQTPDTLISYYDYPPNAEKPEELMDALSENLRKSR